MQDFTIFPTAAGRPGLAPADPAGVPTDVVRLAAATGVSVGIAPAEPAA
jgi:hypothetical protein